MHQSSNESQLPASAAADTQSSSLATAPVTTVPDAQSSSSVASDCSSKSEEAPAVADYEDTVEAASTSAPEMNVDERKERCFNVTACYCFCVFLAKC